MSSQNRVVASSTERVEPIVPVMSRELMQVVLVGLGVGLAINLLYFLLNKFVFGAVMCREEAANSCSDAPQYAMVVSIIIGGLAGLIAMVQIRTYRPLLVIVASVLSMWSFQALIVGLNLWVGIVLMTLLFAATILLFTWVARIRLFSVAVVVSIVLVLLIRYVITLS